MTEVNPDTAVTQIVPAKPPQQKSPLIELANRYGFEPAGVYQVLVDTVFPHGKNDREPTREEVRAFAVVCNEYNLNPFLKQIFAFVNKTGGIVPMVGVDSWLAIINQRPELDGIEVPVELIKWGPRQVPITTWVKGEKQTHHEERTVPTEVTCRIYRKDRTYPTVITEYYDECFRPTETWVQMPARQMRHKAISQCARVAFSITGIHDEDEALDIVARTPEYEVHDDKTPPQAKAKGLDELATLMAPEGEQSQDPTLVGASTGSTEGEQRPDPTPSSGSIQSTPTDAPTPSDPGSAVPPLDIDPGEGDIRGDMKLFELPVPKRVVHLWPIWALGVVGGSSAMKERTWLEMTGGEADGGRRAFLQSVVRKALDEWISKNVKPGEYAAQCAVALYVARARNAK